jgi:DNA-binding protein H-NS
MQTQNTRTAEVIEKEILALQKELADVKEQALASAREQIQQILRNTGMSMEQLMGKAAKKQTGPKAGNTVAPQWKHTDDGSKTWSGRGRKPSWVETHGVRIEE